MPFFIGNAKPGMRGRRAGYDGVKREWAIHGNCLSKDRPAPASLDFSIAPVHPANMKFLNSLAVCALGSVLLSFPASAASEPQESRVYFSAYPAQPEWVRVKRDIVKWRLADELFDEGPGFEGVPGPVLAGTPRQI